MATATTRSPGIRGGYVTYADLTRLVPGTDYFSIGAAQTEGFVGITNPSTKNGLWIYQTGEGRALNVLANGPQTSLGQMVIDSQTATTGGVLWVGVSAAGFSNTTTGAAQFQVSNADATGNVVMISNSGLGYGLAIHSGQNARQINLTGALTTAIAVFGTYPNLTTGNALALATASAGFTASDGLFKLQVASASATGRALYVQQAGTGHAIHAETTKGRGLNVEQNGNTNVAAQIFSFAPTNSDILKVVAYTAATGTAQAISVYGGTNGGTLNFAVKDTGLVFLGNSTEPATPTGGIVYWAEGGALKCKGSSGTVTTLGAA